MILKNDTFIDISKHSNKTIKLADYMVKAEHMLMFNAMVTNINEESTDLDYILAFHKDLATTTKTIEDVHTLLSTVNNDNKVLHLKGEQDLTKIFGDKYDPKEKTLELPLGKIHLKGDISRDYIKELILQNGLGLNSKEYEGLYKNREVLFSQKKTALYTDDEKISYLATSAGRNFYESAINNMKSFNAKYTAFRRNLSKEARALIDDEITFQRSMIDSIAKNTSYITAKNGIEQFGSGTKKKEALLKNIHLAIKKHPFVDAIELDKAVDLAGILEFLEQSKKYKFNLPNKVTLKIRPLGNYNANGLCIRSENIVALDYKKPSAAVHEFIHMIKLEGQEEIARKFRSRLDLTGMSIKDRSYYASTNEIISRLGEITALLEDYNFNENKETIQDFANRVRKIQEETGKHQFNMTKDIDFYLQNSNIYFDLVSMPKEDFTLLKNYYRGYMRVEQDLNIQPIPKLPEINHVEHKVVGTRTRYEGSAVNQINAKNIVEIFENNEKEKIIDPTILASAILKNVFHLDRTRKTIPKAEGTSKSLVLNALCSWVAENNKAIIAKGLLEERTRLDRSFNLFNLISYKEALNGVKTDFDILKNKDSVLTIIDKFEEKYDSKIQEHPIFDPKFRTIDQYSPKSDLKTEFIETREDFKELKQNILKELKKELNPFIKSDSNVFENPLYQEIKNDRDNSILLNEDFQTSNSSMKSIFFSEVDKMSSQLITNGHYEFLSLFDNNDIAPLAFNYEIDRYSDSGNRFKSSQFKESERLFSVNNKIAKEIFISAYQKDYDANKNNLSIKNFDENSVRILNSALAAHSSPFNVTNYESFSTKDKSFVEFRNKISSLFEVAEDYQHSMQVIDLKKTVNNSTNSLDKLKDSELVRTILKKEIAEYNTFDKRMEEERIKELVELNEKKPEQDQDQVQTVEHKEEVKVESKVKTTNTVETKSDSPIDPNQKDDSTPIDPNTVKRGRGRPKKSNLKDPNQLSLW